MINSNPETVSTDFDTSDRLYFESLDEGASAISWIMKTRINIDSGYETRRQSSSFGGQTAINLADRWQGPVCRYWAPAPNASTFQKTAAVSSNSWATLHPQPPGAGVTSIEEALKVPNLSVIRAGTSEYVLGGRGMEIVHNASELSHYMSIATDLNTGHPV